MSLWNPSEVKAAVLLEGFDLDVADRIVARLTRNRLLPDSSVDPMAAVVPPRTQPPLGAGAFSFLPQEQ